MKHSLLKFLAAVLFLPVLALAVTYPLDPGARFEEVRPPFDSADQRPVLFVVPFTDGRFNKPIHKGRSKSDEVSVIPLDRKSLHVGWSNLALGDVSLFLHRQLAISLSQMGYRVETVDYPVSAVEAEERARNAGANFILSGKIKAMTFRKTGADSILGTAFTGHYYHFENEIDLKVRNLTTGEFPVKKEFEFEHRFYNSKSMGALKRETYPIYFIQGLPWLGQAIGEDPDLRMTLGLAPLTATPTRTPPGMEIISQATTGPDLRPTMTMTPTPRPDQIEPYWINPKTGQVMKSDWKFDPNDGTPRSEFKLINPLAEQQKKKPRGRRGSGMEMPEPTATPLPKPE